jgi:hypothetical protein
LWIDLGSFTGPDSEEGCIEGGHVAIDKMGPFEWELDNGRKEVSL